MPHSRVWGWVLLGIGAAVAGCDSGPPTGTVSGDVRFEGQPVEKGTITFYPTDGKSPTSGGEITGGKYSVEVPVGEMTVTLSGEKPGATRKLYDTKTSPTFTATSELLPEKYNTKSNLKLNVQPGPNPKNFDLTAK